MSTIETESNANTDGYTPREIAVNDLDGKTLEEAFADSMVEVEDGQLVAGTVVKVDREEALLDIGFKSEGVIPRRELSLRNDVAVDELVNVGDQIQALVIQKEDKDGRLILSKKRAQYEKAWGDIQKVKDNDGMVKGLVIEVVKGGLIVDIGLRGSSQHRLLSFDESEISNPIWEWKLKLRLLNLTRIAITSCSRAVHG